MEASKDIEFIIAHFIGGEPATEAQRRSFDKRIAVAENIILSLVDVKLNQNQFDALVSFAFHCGANVFEKSEILKLVNAKKFDLVPGQIMKWRNSGGKRDPSLVKCRQIEASLFLKPVLTPRLEDGVVLPNAEFSKGEVSRAVKSSWTLRGLATSALGAVAACYEGLTGFLFSAGGEISSINQAIGPFSALLNSIGANMKLIAFCVILAGLGIATIQRVRAELEGKVA